MSSCNIVNWSSAYEIGHDKIDHEHQKLFLLAQEIYECEDNIDKLKPIIKELIKYTKFHFANEEIYMKSISFSKLEEHKTLHRKIVEDFSSFLKKIDTYSAKEIKHILQQLIIESIIEHILTEDKRVHHFRRNKEELNAIFKWKDSYKINQNMIDDEHKKLFAIAQKALSYRGSDTKKHIKTIIIELYNYMNLHFEHEEKFMESIKYPLLEKHKKLHAKIIEHINGFIKHLPTMKIEEFERKLIEYMDVWLVNHIVHEDKKIMCYLEDIEE